MSIPELCSKVSDSSERKLRFQQRKLEMLQLFRDSLERRLAAIEASISTLEQQITRNNANNSGN